MTGSGVVRKETYSKIGKIHPPLLNLGSCGQFESTSATSSPLSLRALGLGLSLRDVIMSDPDERAGNKLPDLTTLVWVVQDWSHPRFRALYTLFVGRRRPEDEAGARSQPTVY
jgi:hypothetical protein